MTAEILYKYASVEGWPEEERQRFFRGTREFFRGTRHILFPEQYSEGERTENQRGKEDA